MEKTYERWGTQTMSQNYKIVERLHKVNCNEEPFTPEHADCLCRTTSKAASLIQELGEALETIANSPSPNCVVMPRRDFGLEGYPGDKVIARAALSKLKEA